MALNMEEVQDDYCDGICQRDIDQSGEGIQGSCVSDEGLNPEKYSEIQVVNTSKEKSHVCNICNNTFVSKRNLKRHSLIHSGKRPFICDICNNSFTQKGDLKQHTLIHSGEKPYVCNFCNLSFGQRASLKRHTVTHTKEMPHVCELCKKSFSQKGDLKKHSFIHAHEKPHLCNICKKSFSQKHHLQYHLLVHSGEKPHVCNLCEKAFTKKNLLKNHLLSHAKDETHLCKICNKSFTKREKLKEHFLIHNDSRCFICHICNKSINDKEAFRKLKDSSEKGETLYACENCFNDSASKGIYVKNTLMKNYSESPITNYCSKNTDMKGQKYDDRIKQEPNMDYSDMICHNIKEEFDINGENFIFIEENHDPSHKEMCSDVKEEQLIKQETY